MQSVRRWQTDDPRAIDHAKAAVNLIETAICPIWRIPDYRTLRVVVCECHSLLIQDENSLSERQRPANEPSYPNFPKAIGLKDHDRGRHQSVCL